MSNRQEFDLLLEAREAAESGRGEGLRCSVGLSQPELARLAGVSVAAISRWESGKRRPRGAAAVRYGQALRVLAEKVERASSD